MLFWHLGGTIWLFRYVFRDPKVDLRFLAVGALLPDLIDKPIGTVLFRETVGTGRWVGHTLALATVVMAVVLLTTRRGRRRRAWMALAVGALLHLLLDGMWSTPEVLFWPFFGFEFPPGPPEYWSGFFGRLFDSPWTLAGEVVGLAYLGWLWYFADLRDPAKRRVLWRTGRITTA